jgi:hypothetical protein
MGRMGSQDVCWFIGEMVAFHRLLGGFTMESLDWNQSYLKWCSSMRVTFEGRTNSRFDPVTTSFS